MRQPEELEAKVSGSNCRQAIGKIGLQCSEQTKLLRDCRALDFVFMDLVLSSERVIII